MKRLISVVLTLCLILGMMSCASAGKAINDLDARYAAFAKAEACMIDHCLVIPAYVNVGWELTKVNPYSEIYCAYGMMTYRYVNYDTNSDGYTTAEVEELKAAYNAN